MALVTRVLGTKIKIAGTNTYLVYTSRLCHNVAVVDDGEQLCPTDAGMDYAMAVDVVG